MNILVIHGPNLNMLGKRDPKLYGSMTQDELYDALTDEYKTVEFTFYQSNYEGELIDVIHHAVDENYDGLIINPAALTHTSIALRDALEILTIPKVEVHLSDITKREAFRMVDVIKDVCDACFMGKKLESYFEAVEYLLEHANIA
jgi:3-dehydroquinate dehydratase-2